MNNNQYYPGMEFELPQETTQVKTARSTNMPVTKIDSFASYIETIAGEDKVLVKFEADWCMPCRAMSSVVEEIANQHPDVKVLAVDIEGEGLDDILIEYGVRALPAFIHLRDGSKVSSAYGTLSKAELTSLISDD